MLSEPFRLIKVNGPKTVNYKILTANILKVDDYAALEVRSRAGLIKSRGRTSSRNPEFRLGLRSG